ncbi:MAG: hypothetical protein ACI9ZV_000324 [Candidatus Azotimanducaceae bacterium]|jgi:hypothetical protein
MVQFGSSTDPILGMLVSPSQAETVSYLGRPHFNPVLQVHYLDTDTISDLSMPRFD